MPRLSLWKPERNKDFTFFDNRIREMFTIGGTGINIHKYLGPDTANNDGTDSTQPNYASQSATNIQDLLFLENRDRKYDSSIYQLRGIYNVSDIDFDLTQFGLFLQNDTLFISFHINDMINSIGRKLINGDVFELPHLRDFYPLDSALPAALRRYYVVQDASNSSEGFSPTWYPHVWRVKCTPLVDSQEYKDIFDDTAKKADGSDVTGTDNKLRDLLSTYKKELEINTGLKASSTLVTADEVPTTPLHNGYQGHLVGDGLAPNGFPVTPGIAFTHNPSVGDYVLRLDFTPNRLFRYDGARWVKVEDAVRTSTTGGLGTTQKDQFIENTKQYKDDANQTFNSRQTLSDALKPEADS